MKYTPLGISSACPTKERNASCHLIEKENGELIMVDCGPGSQKQLLNSPFKASKITKILITHMHGDHVFDLPGILCTISNQQPPDAGVIDIYGPMGLRQYIRSSLKLTCSFLGFKYRVNELYPNPGIPESITYQISQIPVDPFPHPNEIEPMNIYSNNTVWIIDQNISAAPLKHREMATFGYVIKDDDKSGKLDMEKCQKRGLEPGRKVGELLKNGQVAIDNGEIIQLEDVIGETKIGKKISLAFDTCDSRYLAPIAKSSDLVVYEATHDDELLETALKYGHSTPSMAAQFAKEVEAKKLILTHFSVRYKDTGLLVEQARHIFPNTEAAEELKIWLP